MTQGIPEEVKSDNVPPFNGHKSEEYAQEEGFKHRKETSGWGEAKGDSESEEDSTYCCYKADRCGRKCAAELGRTEQLNMQPLE